MLSARAREENLRQVQQVLMRRAGTKEKIEALVLFLLSDEIRYLTGSEVAMDSREVL